MPLAGVGRPGPGRRGAGADPAVDGGGGLGPVDLGVLDEDLGRQADPVGGLLAGRRCRRSRARRGWRRAGPAPPSASRAEQVAGGVGRADPLGHHAERRTGVHRLDDAERRRAGDLVAGPDRVLHRRGAAPGGQAGEVQVDPAVRRDVERRLRQQRAVGDHRAAVGRAGRAAPPGSRGRAGGRASGSGTPSSSARWATGLATSLRPRPDGASGRVTTPDQLVVGGGDRVEGGHGDLGGAGEDQAHGVRAPVRGWRGG